MGAYTSLHIMQRLPIELVSIVIDRLHLRDAKSLSLVNKEWRQLSLARVFRCIRLWHGKKKPPSQQALDACHRFVIHINSFGDLSFKWDDYLNQV